MSHKFNSSSIWVFKLFFVTGDDGSCSQEVLKGYKSETLVDF